VNDRFDHHPDDDEIVGFLRGTDPGEPPVTLGPGSSLRHRAAVRHARRQATGAALAVGLIAVAVAGSVVGTRHHTTDTPAIGNPIQSPSITTTADESAVPTQPAAVASPTEGRPTISATVAPTTSETVTPHSQGATPVVPKVTSWTFRNPGPITVGQSVFFTARWTARGSVAPSRGAVDFGDGTTIDDSDVCATTGDAPTGTSSSPLHGETTTPSHTYTAPGTYTVTFALTFGCVDGAQDTVVTGTVVVTGPPASSSPSPSVAPTSPSESPSPSTPASTPTLPTP